MRLPVNPSYCHMRSVLPYKTALVSLQAVAEARARLAVASTMARDAGLVLVRQGRTDDITICGRFYHIRHLWYHVQCNISDEGH